MKKRPELSPGDVVKIKVGAPGKRGFQPGTWVVQRVFGVGSSGHVLVSVVRVINGKMLGCIVSRKHLWATGHSIDYQVVYGGRS